MASGADGGVVLPSLLVVLVLAGLAAVLCLAAGLTAAGHRWSGRVPYALRRLPVAVLTGALGVAGVGVVTYAVPASHLAASLLALVVLPVVLGLAYAERRTELGRLDGAGVTAMAWGPPFLVGTSVVLALTVLGIALLDPPTGTAGTPPFLWGTVLGGAAVTNPATVALVRWLSRLVAPETA